MGSNLDAANDLLVKAEGAARFGNYEKAEAYAKIAQVAALAHMADKIGAVAKNIDRLASVVNQGKTWH